MLIRSTACPMQCLYPSTSPSASRCVYAIHAVLPAAATTRNNGDQNSTAARRGSAHTLTTWRLSSCSWPAPRRGRCTRPQVTNQAVPCQETLAVTYLNRSCPRGLARSCLELLPPHGLAQNRLELLVPPRAPGVSCQGLAVPGCVRTASHLRSSVEARRKC